MLSRMLDYASYLIHLAAFGLFGVTLQHVDYCCLYSVLVTK